MRCSGGADPPARARPTFCLCAFRGVALAAVVRPQAQWVQQQLQAELPQQQQQQQRSAVLRTASPAMVATGPGLFTQSKPEDRRVVPDDAGDRTVFKVVYVVLESQYQSSLTAACKRINAGQPDVAVECSGYILEELRDADNFEQFKKDVGEANIFIGSLIFVQELADKVVEVVEPNRDRLDAVCVFPSMPAVMRMNKIGSFTMGARGPRARMHGSRAQRHAPPRASHASPSDEARRRARRPSRHVVVYAPRLLRLRAPKSYRPYSWLTAVRRAPGARSFDGPVQVGPR